MTVVDLILAIVFLCENEHQIHHTVMNICMDNANKNAPVMN